MHDYHGGKLDWLAAGLPIEGQFRGRPTAGSLARADVPTCLLDEVLDSVRARVREAGWDACVVVNKERVVLGLLRSGELDGPPDRTAEQTMRPAPSTFRPHVSVVEMAEFMTGHDVVSSPVTTSDGGLVGLLLREEAVLAAHELHRAMHHDEGNHDGS